MEKLGSFSLDCDKGSIFINGRECTNVTAFSLVYKNGEYGLKISQDTTYASKINNSRFFVEILPDEILDQRISDKGKKP